MTIALLSLSQLFIKAISMAQQSGKQQSGRPQPFRFWIPYWTNPPPRLPPSRSSPPTLPQTPSTQPQPRSPAQPASQPQQTRRPSRTPPSPSPSPSPSSSLLSPSSSRRSSQPPAKQRARQEPPPSPRKSSPQSSRPPPSPTQGTLDSQPPAGSQDEPQMAAQSTLLVSQEEATSKQPNEPQPTTSEPQQNLPTSQLLPEASFKENLESKSASPETTIPQKEPKEIKEDDFIAKPILKELQPSGLLPNSEGNIENNQEPKRNIQASHFQDEVKNEPILQVDEKPKEPMETAKPDEVTKKEVTPSSLEQETIDMPKPQTETQATEKTITTTNELKEKNEQKFYVDDIDSKKEITPSSLDRETIDKPKQQTETQATEKPNAAANEDLKEKKEQNLFPVHTSPKPTGQSPNAGHLSAGARIEQPNIAGALPMRGPSSNGDKANFRREMREGVAKFIQKLNVGDQHRTGGDHGISIITLAGENQGASMIIGHENPSKEGVVPVQGGYKLNKDTVEATKRREESEGEKPGITTRINSNVQSINNSVLHESSCSEGDPGIHLTLSSK